MSGGIGGAPFLVAGLVLALGRSQHLAQGTVLAVMLAPMSLPAVWVMRDRVKVLWRHTLVGVLTYAVCSNLGARIAFALPQQSLSMAFSALLIGLGLHYLLHPADNHAVHPLIADRPTLVERRRIPFSLTTVGVIGCGIGVAGGLFGIGAGVLMVPILITAVGLHKDDARALSLAILLPPVSVGAVLEYEHHGDIDWSAAVVIFIAYLVTNLPGGALGRKHDTRRFLRITGAVLLALGLAMVAVAWGGQ